MKMVKGQHYWWALRRCRFIAVSLRPSSWKDRALILSIFQGCCHSQHNI